MNFCYWKQTAETSLTWNWYDLRYVGCPCKRL